MEMPPSLLSYLTLDEILFINEQVNRQSGLLGERTGLESALNRPRMAAHYTQVDLIEQAAFLIEGIAMNHPFVDGNKRTALVSGITFLRLNSSNVVSAPTEAARLLIQLVVEGDVGTSTSWLRNHSISWTGKSSNEQESLSSKHEQINVH